MNATIIGGDLNTQKLIMQANISFMHLRKKVLFTYMNDPAEDIYEDDESIPQNKTYQRRIKSERINDIKQFIRNSILNEIKGNQVAVIFPTAMLLAACLDRPFQLRETITVDDLISSVDDFYIVDGQHRLFAMMDLYEEVSQITLFEDLETQAIRNYLQRYVFNCTVLLNFDLWEQAQIFADVNFNQTKVNKSLYYTIYGMNYSQNPIDLDRNYMYIAHRLVKYLNNNNESPLYKCIKMLGTGEGFISQAFLADSLLLHLKSPRGIWYFDPQALSEKPSFRHISVELISYFDSVKRILNNYWPDIDGKHRSILCKTTGIGALIKLLAYLHWRMPKEVLNALNNQPKAQIYSEYSAFVEPYLNRIKDHGDDLFSNQGKFAGTGGKGLESQLFSEMKKILNS